MSAAISRPETVIIDRVATRAIRRRRRSFLVFMRILFKCLDRAGDKPLLISARQVIAECIKLHRSGHSEHTSLIEGIETKLHVLVGRDYWLEAKTYLGHYHIWKEGGVCLMENPLALKGGES